jgi:hypothetical protein
VGHLLEEMAEGALAFRGELVDTGEMYEAGARFFPEGLGLVEEFGGDTGQERAGSSGADAMKGLRGKHFAGAGFALDIDEAKMGGCAAHARKELLHYRAAAGHGAEHPSVGVENLGFEGFEIENLGNRKVLRFLFVGVELCEIHVAFRPAEGFIGRRKERVNGKAGGRGLALTRVSRDSELRALAGCAGAR